MGHKHEWSVPSHTIGPFICFEGFPSSGINLTFGDSFNFFPVHCSAGIGRSGTLILVDSCLVLAGMGEELSLSMVVGILLDMRTYRMGLIQTEDQLRFSVDAIVQGIKQLGLEQGEKKVAGTQHVNGKRLKEQDVMEEEEERENHVNAKKRKNSQS